MIEEIRNGEQLLAIIVRHTFDKPGISFFTANDLSQQLAYMRHPAGKVIEPHVHNAVRRKKVLWYGVMYSAGFPPSRE